MSEHTYAGTMQIVTCPVCHIDFGLTDSYYRHLRKTGEKFSCPAGHSGLSWKPGPSDADKLRAAEARETSLRDQLHAAEADAEKSRSMLIRDRERFSNGVCPCCNRTFQNVLNHMRGEHPEYDPKDLKRPTYACSCGRDFETFHGLRIHQGRLRGDDWTDPKQGRYWRHLTVTA